jgi:hypothetical protein
VRKIKLANASCEVMRTSAELQLLSLITAWIQGLLRGVAELL